MRAADGRFLAWAAYSPASSIRARAWSFSERDVIDAAWMRDAGPRGGRRAGAASRRPARRCGWCSARPDRPARADRRSLRRPARHAVPGRGRRGLARRRWSRRWSTATGCADVFDRSDGATRAREGLPAISGVLAGAEPPETIEVDEHGLRFLVDVRRGHKTGFYIDQRDNRRLARAWRSSSPRGTATAARAQLLLLHRRLLARAAGGRRRVGALDRFVGRGAADGARSTSGSTASTRRGRAGTRPTSFERCAR